MVSPGLTPDAAREQARECEACESWAKVQLRYGFEEICWLEVVVLADPLVEPLVPFVRGRNFAIVEEEWRSEER